MDVAKRKRRTRVALATVVAAAALLFVAWYTLGRARGDVETAQVRSAGQAVNEQVNSSGEVEIPHLHGLQFSADGRQLFVAAHDGLRVFAEGAWHIPNLPAHDYMGFSATDNGFYSSGHPHPAAGLVNPFGLVKSTDGGQALTKLGFEGESDFHLMGVGYANHALYVLNPAPNSRLREGVHYSLDDGQTWKQSALQGITAQPFQIAVHPTEANVVAMATEGGLFLSSDYGDTFERVGESSPVTAVSFSPKGEQLLFGYDKLYTYKLASKQVTALPTPVLSPVEGPAVSPGAPIGYIAVNPVRPDEMVFGTFGKDIYLSKDGGQSWEQIVQAGKG